MNLAKIYGYYDGRPIHDQEVWKELLKNYIPAGCYGSNSHRYGFVTERINKGDKAPSLASIRTEQNWVYSKDGKVRVLNNWMGDIENCYNDSDIWRRVTPVWHGKQFMVNIETKDKRRTTISLFKYIAIKFGMAKESNTVIAEDGNYRNLNINNIKVI